MILPRPLRAACAGVALLFAGCWPDATDPPRPPPPARIDAVPGVSATGVVGSLVATPIAVVVSDSSGHALPGARVLFSITTGNGSVSPALAVTNAEGRAETKLTLGTIAGGNEVTAAVAGVALPARFAVNGLPDAARSVTIAPRLVRFPVGTDSLRLTMLTVDVFGNRATEAASIAIRDQSLLTVDDDGFLRVQRRGGTTYVVATVASFSDSVLAIVLAPGDSPCTAVSTPVVLDPGKVTTGLASSGFCIGAGATDAEFVLAPYFDTGSPGSNLIFQAVGSGLGVLPLASVASRQLAVKLGGEPQEVPFAERFEVGLRQLERRELPRYVPAARSWQAGAGALRSTEKLAPGGAQYSAIPANLAVGDLVTLNTNANEFCTNPRLRTGRVKAISAEAIVVADTSNPPNGFTDAEYASVGVTFDTLVHLVDVGAFGEPSDIDHNGRAVIFYTRAVNELSPRGSSSVVLGFYFSRDLLPNTGTGACVGSNVGEMFYLLVPDSAGVASDPRSKSFVLATTNGTVSHEYQHLINASRRMFVNSGAEASEEVWLNEGLSHIAEELVFYASSKLQPRQNLDASVIQGATAGAFQQFMQNNARRYRAYLRSTALQAPVGFNAGDDDLETRGAIWSFLRYAADRLVNGAVGTDFWFRLVNSRTAGVANLRDVFGTEPAPLMRDWAIAEYADDTGSGVEERFSHLSWNFRSILPALGTSFPLTDPLLERRLSDNVAASVQMQGGGVSFLRFLVPAGHEALFLVTTSTGQPSPASLQLSVLRIR